MSGSYKIPLLIIQLLLFILGLLIQLKIIYVSWKDREGKTWQIHMTHSIALIIYFAFMIPFWNVTNAFPNLSLYTGEWFCYLATFISLYGISIITFNSLLIAVMKYSFVIHNTKILKFGEERAKKGFLILSLTLPLILAIISVVAKDIDAYADLLSCFGLTDQALKQYNTWENKMQKFFLCNLNTTAKDISDRYVLYFMTQCLCILKSCIYLLVSTNIPEAFFYYKIFKKMRR
jgi:hypothetical protein